MLCLAAAWRLAYLWRLSRTPFAPGLDADARIYWAWSEAILRQGLAPPAPFFLAPLYPYVLAAMRASGAESLTSVLSFQAVLGAAAVVLLADATARVAGRGSALCVGVILALGQAVTFFDGLVLPESLLFFLESLLVWLVARTDWSSARIGHYARYGLLVGVLAQGRASNAALLVLAIPLLWAGRAEAARTTQAALAMLAAFVLCCAPATIANFRSSAELIPFTYNLGFNLYLGNNPDAQGTYVDITGGSIPVALAGTSPTTGGALDGRAYLLATEGLRLTPAQSSAYWTRKAAAYVRSAPLSALGLAGKKVLLAWNHRATPQIESMKSVERHAGPLGVPVLGSFAFLALIGLSGAACALRRGASEYWLVGYLTLGSLAMTSFFVTDRYRHHLIPALAVCAGMAISDIARVVSGKGGKSARSLLALACAAGVVFAPVGGRERGLGDWALAADDAMRLQDRGHDDEAASAFAIAEASLADMRPAALSMSARTALASFYLRHGVALESLGRQGDAIVRWERAIEINPNDAASLGRLQLAYQRDGRTVDSARVRRALESAPGGRGVMLLNDGWLAAGRGDLLAAEALFTEAVQASPGLSMAWEGLIRLRIQTARYEEAVRYLELARGAGLNGMSADIYACFLAVERGDLAAGRRAIARVPIEPVPKDPVLVRLLAQARRTLDARP